MLASGGRLRYFLLISGISVLALVGYAGYVIHPRFDLPAVTGVGLLILAASAGIASFFSPCSFPLLVTLLARETNAGKTEGTVIRQRCRSCDPTTGRDAPRLAGPCPIEFASHLFVCQIRGGGQTS